MKQYQVLFFLVIGTIVIPQITFATLQKNTPAFPRQRVRPSDLPRIRWYRRDTYHPTVGVRRFIPEQFSTSVIIPCYYKHAPLLLPLIADYAHQTILPDEVVISLSEYSRVADSTLQELAQSSWPFQVTLVLVLHQQYAGENRNTACDHATGDVLICQDADDIPHPQRVEIIRHFFDQYPVEHLFHEWIDVTQEGIFEFPEYSDLEKISFAYHRAFKELWQHAHFTNGNVAIIKKVFEKVRWSSARRSQDSEFNREVYKHFEYGIAIQAKLLGYRQFLSSAREQNNLSIPDRMHNTTEKSYAHYYQPTIIYAQPRETTANEALTRF